MEILNTSNFQFSNRKTNVTRENLADLEDPLRNVLIRLIWIGIIDRLVERGSEIKNQEWHVGVRVGIRWRLHTQSLLLFHMAWFLLSSLENSEAEIQ